jgi:hypothetical protein
MKNLILSLVLFASTTAMGQALKPSKPNIVEVHQLKTTGSFASVRLYVPDSSYYMSCQNDEFQQITDIFRIELGSKQDAIDFILSCIEVAQHPEEKYQAENESIVVMKMKNKEVFVWSRPDAKYRVFTFKELNAILDALKNFN